MTNKKQIYKCEVCGNIVEVIHEGEGELVCCNQPMTLQVEKEGEEGLEKHLPVIEFNGRELLVSVGSILHPMSEEHYIEWIEVGIDDLVYKKFLNPTDEPSVTFDLPSEYTDISVRSYCNIHGLWKSK